MGFLTSGNSVLQAIDAVPVGGTSGTTPTTPVVINSVKTYTDDNDGEVLFKRTDQRQRLGDPHRYGHRREPATR